LWFLYGVRDELTDDVSETAVGLSFTGHEVEPQTAWNNSAVSGRVLMKLDI
jgi:hypothetical protein